MIRAPRSPLHGPTFQDVETARLTASGKGGYAAVKLPAGPLEPALAASLARNGLLKF